MQHHYALVRGLETATSDALKKAIVKLNQLTLVLPGAYDVLAPELVEEYVDAGAELCVLSITPLGAFTNFQRALISTAAVYQLQRLAIPLHYHNLKDRIVSEYGVGVASDREFYKILQSSEHVTELSTDVFRANHRTRDLWPDKALARWVELLRSGLTANLYDVIDLRDALSQWYENVITPKEDSLGSSEHFEGWIERRSSRLLQLYESSNAVLKLRLQADPAASYLYGMSLRSLLSGQTEPLDGVALKQIARTRTVWKQVANASTRQERFLSLFEHARLWIDYIANPRTRGQEQKWRGWYLLPEHGPITTNKLKELQLIIASLHRLAGGGVLNVDTSPTGINNVQELLRAGRVQYQTRYSSAQKRNLFVRQQKNYLIRLGLIHEHEPNELSVTTTGREWIAASRDELPDKFYQVLLTLRWSWCNMPFARFLEQLVQRVDNFVSFRELHNWIIHAYDDNQLEEMAVVLKQYRHLTPAERSTLDDRIDTLLRKKLVQHMSENAIGHYRTKIKDLMHAFEATGRYRLAKNAPPDAWILRYESNRHKD